LHGKSEIQTIVLDSSSSPKGFFFVYYRGEKSGAISVDSTSAEMANILNEMHSFENIQVTKYLYGDGVYNSAWVVTFPARYGDVEDLVIDDQSVSGVDCAVHVFPMINISIVANKDDLSGFFQIAVGHEITIPLSWDASDAAVLNALQNLTNVGKVQMLGLSENFASVESWTEAVQMSNVEYACEIVSPTGFRVDKNLTGRIAIGDRVVFEDYNDTLAGRFVTFMEVFDNVTFVNVTEEFDMSVSRTKAHFRIMSLSYRALPGRFSYPARAQIIGALQGYNNITITENLDSFECFIWGRKYNITSNTPCGSHFCLVLSEPYSGPDVFENDYLTANVNVFMPYEPFFFFRGLVFYSRCQYCWRWLYFFHG